MSPLKERITSLPGARALWHTLKSLPGQLQGMPPIDYSALSGATLRASVGTDDPVIFDVGCNDGLSTLWFLEIFGNPRIFCFEPDPRAISRFRDKVGGHPNITLFETAVSDRDGTIDFYQSGGRRENEWIVKAMPEGWDLSGSIREPYRHLDKHPLVTFENTIAVPTTTLDKVCKDQRIHGIDLLWLDVQGAELDVIRGAAATLARTHLLYTEYSDRELYRGQVGLREIAEHLPDFELLKRYPDDALFRNRRLAV